MKRGTPQHPKTLWLKEGLGLSSHEVVGLLEMLFHFTAQHAPQGDLGKWSNSQIAVGVEWKRNADELVQQLTDAGYLDVSKKHRLIVHDWHTHADQGVKKFLQRNGLAFVTVSGQRPPKAGRRPPTKEDTAGHGRTAVSLSLSVPLSVSPPEATPAATTPGIRIPPCEPSSLNDAIMAECREIAGLTSKDESEVLKAHSMIPPKKPGDRPAWITNLDTASEPWRLRTHQDLCAELSRLKAPPPDPADEHVHEGLPSRGPWETA